MISENKICDCGKAFTDHTGETFKCSKCLEETDPDGLQQGDTGAKFDQGKIRVGLLKRFGLALLAVGDLATGGADKYADHGWVDVKDGIQRYDDALFAHYLREMFEDVDPDMKVKHEVQTAWNALAKLQLMIEDDSEWKDRLMKRIATNRHTKLRKL